MNVVRDVFVLRKFGSYLAKRTDFFNHQKICNRLPSNKEMFRKYSWDIRKSTVC